MNKFILSILLICFCTFIKAQSLVIDPTLITTLGITHNEQQNTLNNIKDSEGQIRNYQILIQAKLHDINKMQEKVFNYLSTAQAVIKNGKDIIYASDIAKDIAEYQSKAFSYAKGDPKLITVCAKTEYELISRSADLFLYIYDFAVTGGEKNLLDNKQRIELVTYVVDELRRMRALSYSVCRQIRQAAREGVMKTLYPKQFRYVKNGQRTVEKILKDINL